MNVAEPQPTVPKPNVRWLHVAPDRLAIALLLLEGFLLLSEESRWFPKGWAALTAAVAVALGILFVLLLVTSSLLRRWRSRLGIRPLLFALGLAAIERLLMLPVSLGWLAISEKMDRTVGIAQATVGVVVLSTLFCFATARLLDVRFQFSLRSFLVLAIVIAISCCWLTTAREKAREQEEAVQATSWLWIAYDYDVDGLGQVVRRRPREPNWLRELLGGDFFTDVVGAVSYYHVSPAVFSRRIPVADAELAHLKRLTRLRWLLLGNTQVTDAGMVHLKGLPGLEHLSLAKTEISDAGLERLEALTQLRFLDLEDTRVTDEAVKKLQEALPNCRIVR